MVWYKCIPETDKGEVKITNERRQLQAISLLQNGELSLKLQQQELKLALIICR